MTRKTLITVAVTGNQASLDHHPGLPCTPEQIATAAIESAKAGAAIAQIHVRYPDGRPSMELAHYHEVVDRVRGSSTDIIINLTTGPAIEDIEVDFPMSADIIFAIMQHGSGSQWLTGSVMRMDLARRLPHPFSTPSICLSLSLPL